MRAQHISWGQVFTLCSETLQFHSTASAAAFPHPCPFPIALIYHILRLQNLGFCWIMTGSGSKICSLVLLSYCMYSYILLFISFHFFILPLYFSIHFFDLWFYLYISLKHKLLSVVPMHQLRIHLSMKGFLYFLHTCHGQKNHSPKLIKFLFSAIIIFYLFIA